VSELNCNDARGEVDGGLIIVDDDELDSLLNSEIINKKEIHQIVNPLMNTENDFSYDLFFLDDVNPDQNELNELGEKNIATSDGNVILNELEELQSRYEFECEYVDQLEKEIISITNDRDLQVAELTNRLEQSRKIKIELESTQVLLKESNNILEISQAKLLEVTGQRNQFEKDIIRHLSNQSLQGLENEYVSDSARVHLLEHQIEELQNMILQQASKVSEYEAAIQHWKEQSVRHQHHSLQLSSVLERLLDEKPVKHLTTSFPEHLESAFPPFSKPPELLVENGGNVPKRSSRAKVDLPSFLVNRQQ
jgi:hypothetical protein